MSTTNLEIHKSIHEKLEYFIEKKKIPNIIFHGESGSGKRTILEYFWQPIARTKDKAFKE